MSDNNNDDEARARAMNAMWEGARGDRTHMAGADQQALVSGVIADSVETVVMQLQAITALQTGALVTRANLLALVMKAASDQMRASDEGLAQEFIDNFAAAMRSKHAPESAEHLDAMKAIGVVLHHYSEIERRELAKS